MGARGAQPGPGPIKSRGGQNNGLLLLRTCARGCGPFPNPATELTEGGELKPQARDIWLNTGTKAALLNDSAHGQIAGPSSARRCGLLFLTPNAVYVMTKAVKAQQQMKCEGWPCPLQGDRQQ